MPTYSPEELEKRIADGRTDGIIDFLKLPDWKERAFAGPVSIPQWLVYYDDVTGLKLLEERGLDFSKVDVNGELGNASFFGHWKTCDFMLAHGADPNYKIPATHETPLHNALCKAKRPYFIQVIRLLLEHGADPHAKTIPGQETGGFMRDICTRGETPLHRAAAFADAPIIELLLKYGAKKDARDANGDSPLTWASWHLRPGRILDLLCFDTFKVGGRSIDMLTSDHGDGWGNGMEWKFRGAYLPESDPQHTK